MQEIDNQKLDELLKDLLVKIKLTQNITPVKKSIYRLLCETHNSLDSNHRPMNNYVTKYLFRLNDWLIKEEFTLNIIQECPYNWIINDLKNENLHDYYYGEIFWDQFKIKINEYLK